MPKDPRDPADEYRDRNGDIWTMMALGPWSDGDQRYAEYQCLRSGVRTEMTMGRLNAMVTSGEWEDATPPMPPCNGRVYGHHDECRGEVDWCFTGIGMKSAPLCEHHHRIVLDANQKAMEKYHEYASPSPPDWYDYLNAGEYWSEEDAY